MSPSTSTKGAVKTSRPGKPSKKAADTQGPSPVKAATTKAPKPAKAPKAPAAPKTPKAPKVNEPLVPLSELKPRSGYGISRIDVEAGSAGKNGKPRGEQHGWYARVNHPENGTVQKWFGDDTYGSKKKSLEAAEAFRDALFNLLPERQRRLGAVARKTA